MSNTAPDDSAPRGELYCTTCEKTFHSGERCPTDGTRLMKIKPVVDPFVGRDLDGRYTVLEKLGQGGMGAVYRAQQHSVDREVAIKVVNSNLITDPEVIKRFLREAKLASKLAHPNAVAVLDFNQTDDGVFYLVMELVSGRTLDQVFRAEKTFRPERVVRIGTQVLEALDGAHALSIIHRDLKPSNIMVLAQGRDLVKVLDFGLAKSMSPDETSTTMTGAGSVVGTPAFMPPELATGTPCDGRADLYSLGVILYLLGSGRLPFMAESAFEFLALHGSNEPAPPMTGVPARLARVIEKLLEKDPANRFQTASEALQALETSITIATPPPSVREVEERRRPSRTEVQRLITGETMLASDVVAPAAPVAPVAAPVASVSVVAPTGGGAKRRLLLGLGALAAIGATAALAAFLLGGSDDTATVAPAPPPAAPIVERAVEPTPPPASPTVTPAATPTPTQPPAVATTPDLPPAPTAKPAATIKKPSKPTKPTKPSVTPPPPTPTTTPTTTPPPRTGSGTAPVPTPF